VVTDIARQELRSYKQLPKNFYHIQTKFRDERRPALRHRCAGREFTMKDAYSFDRDAGCHGQATRRMCAGLPRHLRPLRPAATAPWRLTRGAIGGDLTARVPGDRRHGEDAIVYCPTSRLRRQHRAAVKRWPAAAPRAAPAQALVKQATPGKSTCADVAEPLGLPLSQTVKSLGSGQPMSCDEEGDVVKTTVWLLLAAGDGMA